MQQQCRRRAPNGANRASAPAFSGVIDKDEKSIHGAWGGFDAARPAPHSSRAAQTHRALTDSNRKGRAERPLLSLSLLSLSLLSCEHDAKQADERAHRQRPSEANLGEL
jgi:hypothetical protein